MHPSSRTGALQLIDHSANWMIVGVICLNMPDPDLSKHGMDDLAIFATHLNAIRTADPGAKPFYELMSGALVWPDETNSSTPVEVVWALRQLWAYRTYLMLNKNASVNTVWQKCVTLFPNWIGFLPERRTATPELLAEYRRGNVSTESCLRQLDRETEANDK
jgi:hypothetical protein